MILIARGGHRTPNLGTEAGDFGPWLHSYGVTTIILRNRLRADGYGAEIEAVGDTMQAIRLVRADAAEWRIDPVKIGVTGFSAGAEPAGTAAIAYLRSSGTTRRPMIRWRAFPRDRISGGLLYPGPTPSTRAPERPLPADPPPTFLTTVGSGDRLHAIWADDYFRAMLRAGVPHRELRVDGRGEHGGGRKDRGAFPLPRGRSDSWNGGVTWGFWRPQGCRLRRRGRWRPSWPSGLSRMCLGAPNRSRRRGLISVCAGRGRAPRCTVP